MRRTFTPWTKKHSKHTNTPDAPIRTFSCRVHELLHTRLHTSQSVMHSCKLVRCPSRMFQRVARPRAATKAARWMTRLWVRLLITTQQVFLSQTKSFIEEENLYKMFHRGWKSLCNSYKICEHMHFTLSLMATDILIVHVMWYCGHLLYALCI